MKRKIKRIIKRIKKKLRRLIGKLKRVWRRSAICRWIKRTKKKVHRAYIKRWTRKIMRKSVIEPNKIAIMTNTFTYTCNPKYIYEELIRQKLNYRIVWLVNSDHFEKFDYPGNIRLVNVNSKKGIKEVYTSKIWLDNGIAFSDRFDKKEGQIHIQTMHGSLGIKRLDNAVAARNQRGESGQRVVFRESNETDYVITNSQFEEDVFHSVFWKNTPMVRWGHARTDVLFSTEDRKVAAIREELFRRYKIPMDKKLVLYAPTHRRDLSIEDLSIDYKDMGEALQSKFGGEFVTLIRMHKRTKNILLKTASFKDAKGRYLFDVTDYPDIQELMLVASVGITDYSSWIFDYVLTRKPGFIFATDLERYNNRTGLYYPLEETPFPVCQDHEQLIEKIADFDNEYFLQRVEEFLEDKEAVDDGHAAERIVSWIQTLAPST